MKYLLVFLVGCGASLTPAEAAELQDTAAQIAKCRAEGLACKADGGTGCLQVFDACMRDAGLAP